MKVYGENECWEVMPIGADLIAITHDSWENGKPFMTIGDVIFPINKAEEIAKMILLEAERKKKDDN